MHSQKCCKLSIIHMLTGTHNTCWLSHICNVGMPCCTQLTAAITSNHAYLATHQCAPPRKADLVARSTQTWCGYLCGQHVVLRTDCFQQLAEVGDACIECTGLIIAAVPARTSNPVLHLLQLAVRQAASQTTGWVMSATHQES